MKEKIYIVTGATGFVGGVLAKKLASEGKTVHALARSKEKAKLVLGDINAKVFYGDIRNIEDLKQMFTEENADYVFMHTAAMVLIHGNKKLYAEMRTINIDAIENVISVCLQYNAKLIHVSSVHAITEPKKRALTCEIDNFDQKTVHGPYAKTKAEGSRLVLDAVKNRGLDAVLVHPGGITGPGDYGDSHLTQLVIDYLDGRIPAATSGGYDFVDVRDVADGIILAEKAEKGNCFLLTNRFYSVRELLDTLHEITNGRKIKRTLPMWLAKVGLPFLTLGAKLAKKRPLYTRYSLYTLSSNSNYSHEKATKQLGYNPRGLKESLKDTYEFLLERDGAERYAPKKKKKEKAKNRGE